MIEYCQRTPSAWPGLIQFETMGHCDEKEGRGTEWSMIKALENEGYVLVNTSRHNSHLVFGSALATEQRLKDWVSTWKCTRCGRKQWQAPPWRLPFKTTHNGCFCQLCR